MNCGLLGAKLSHSYSPQIHKLLASYTYDLFEKQPDQLAQFLKEGSFTGINVTIPYKKSVMPYCDHLTDIAKKLGAVNTIVRDSSGFITGHNTDYFGFQYMLQKSGLIVSGKKVLVLGSGGASTTAVAVLEEMGANAIVISRSGVNHYGNLHLHRDASVIVNTTPVGMYPEVGVSPVDLSLFPNLLGVLDIIYNPSKTKLLMDAENLGLIALNGLWMLVAQAKESAEWFTGTSIHDSVIPEIYHSIQQQMENIVLIGMPGSGKTTIGQILAQKTGKSFCDIDDYIVKKSGMSIPKIFNISGESEFRQMESNALSEIGKKSNMIISTGGGCVTREENYSHLHQNGKIIWLKRDIDLLPTDGRPLSTPETLNQMYAARASLYEHFADYIVDNNGGPEDTVSAILSLEDNL